MGGFLWGTGAALCCSEVLCVLSEKCLSNVIGQQHHSDKMHRPGLASLAHRCLKKHFCPAADSPMPRLAPLPARGSRSPPVPYPCPLPNRSFLFSNPGTG